MRSGQKSQLLIRERIRISDLLFAELVVWKVPEPLAGSQHGFKYRLALVHDGTCVVRYDNDAGKGDHKHLEEEQVSYLFMDLQLLQRGFWEDAELWRLKT